jgi:tRNA uridine 5-carbamoylmethylation protein Kti12
MPCLILTGHPCAGKTTLARMIRDRALQHPSGLITNVILVNEENTIQSFTEQKSAITTNSSAGNELSMLEMDKSSLYETAQIEKKTRGALKAGFERAVANASITVSTSSVSSTLVILDSVNYIKGYRYELYCISKAARQAHAVVWVLNDVQLAEDRWRARIRDDSKLAQPEDIIVNNNDRMKIFHELVKRYEPPDSRNRWDQPLFKFDMRTKQSSVAIQSGDDAGQASTLDRQLLDHSVYNMHDIRESLTANVSDTTAVSPALPDKTSDDSSMTSQGGPSSTIPQTKASLVNFKRPGSSLKRNLKVSPPSSSEAVRVPGALPPSLDSSEGVSVPYLDMNALATLDHCHGGTNQRVAMKDIAVSQLPDKVKEMTKKEQRTLFPAEPIEVSLEARIDNILSMFLTSVKPLVEGTSTKLSHSTDSNVLQMVESVAQQGCAAISNAIRVGCFEEQQSGKDRITIRTRNGHEARISLNSIYRQGSSLPNLQLIRQQFIKWITSHPPDDMSEKGVLLSFVIFFEAQQKQRLP